MSFRCTDSYTVVDPGFLERGGGGGGGVHIDAGL